MRALLLVAVLAVVPLAQAQEPRFGTDPAGDDKAFADPGAGVRPDLAACGADSADIRAWHVTHADGAVVGTLVLADPRAPVDCGGAPLPTHAMARGIQFRLPGAPGVVALSMGEWEVRDRPDLPPRAARCAVIHFADDRYAYVDGWRCTYRPGTAAESWAVPNVGTATLLSDGSSREYDLRGAAFADVFAVACSAAYWVQACDDAR